MFEINVYLLNKMGWINYSQVRGIRIGNSIHKLNPIFPPIAFDDDPLVRHFYDDVDSKVCYVIKELSTNEKQNTENLYKFIIMDYKLIDSLGDPKDFKPSFEINQFESNESLFKLVIKYEACNEEYKRHFKINKLLK